MSPQKSLRTQHRLDPLYTMPHVYFLPIAQSLSPHPYLSLARPKAIWEVGLGKKRVSTVETPVGPEGRQG